MHPFVLFQASQIFQSVKIDMLSRMIPFFDFSVVEKISVDAVKHNFVAMKVNHLLGAVHFGKMVCGLVPQVCWPL